MLVAETPRFPDLAQSVFEAGPAAIVGALARFLEYQTAAKQLSVADPGLAAEQFLGAVRGHVQLRALFGIDQDVSPEALDRIVRHAVQAFLAAHSPRN
jgi:hypothetical protein